MACRSTCMCACMPSEAPQPRVWNTRGYDLAGMHKQQFRLCRVAVSGVAASRVFMIVATEDAETGGAVVPSTKKVILAAKNAPMALGAGAGTGSGGSSPSKRALRTACAASDGC